MKTPLTGRILRFSGGKHREAQDLLPWYLAARLDPAEHERVQAHLSVCADCQTDLRFQQALRIEVADQPIDVDQSWARMQALMDDAEAPASRPMLPARRGRALRGGGGGVLAQGPAWGAPVLWSGAVLAAVILAVIAWPPAVQPAGGYHALGARTASPVGNVLVIFRPETTERGLRETLRASHARLVDGPTAADAYVLFVPDAERAAALSVLRARPEVVMAQPIDPGGGN